MPQSFVKHIFQDSRGYLWICTQDGVAQFNGYEFFNFYFDPFDPKAENSLISNQVLETVGWKNDQILISSPSGLCFLNPITKEFRNIYFKKSEEGLIYDIEKVDSNELLIATTVGLYKGIIDDSLKLDLQKLVEGRVDRIQKSGSSIFYTKRGKIFKLGASQQILKGVNQFFIAENGILFSKQNILFSTKNGKIDTLKTNISVNSIKKIGTNYWVASNKGILIYNEKLKLENRIIKSSVNGILSNNVLDIFRDNFGIIWIGTDAGLNKLDVSKQQFLHIQRSAVFGVPSANNNVWCFEKLNDYIYAGHADGILAQNTKIDSSIWIPSSSYVLSLGKIKNELIAGTENGLFSLKNNKLTKINIPDSVKLEFVYQISAIGDSVYVGCENGLAIFNKKFKLLNFISIPKVRKIVKSSNDEIFFIAYPSGVYKLETKNNIIGYKYTEIPQIKSLYSLCAHIDGNENLWIGLFGGGAIKFNLKTQKTVHFSTKSGLPNNSIYGILQDDFGNLWMSTNSGLAKLYSNEQKFNSFNVNDGLQSMEFNSGAYFRSDDGKLYFGGVNGFNIVDPKKYNLNKVQPIVHVSSVKFQRKELLNNIENNVLSLSSNQNSITIKVDGIHYSSPEENIYSYFMEGLNEEWVSFKNKREFYFSNLEHGEYTFKVRVANSDRVYTESPTVLKIIIEPAFYQTWLFRIIVSLLILGFLIAVYYYRTQQRKIQRRLLERKIRERTKEVEHQKSILEQQKALIEEEKDREEKLLLNVLPLETARELISTGKAAPKHYKMASVMFADFKNFTKITENLSPNELVEELDNFFAHFDDIVDQFGIEKIKTSGDAYMCAGGIPIRNRTNPVECVLAALEFLKFVEKVKEDRINSKKPQWDIRIGIHTGELVAGVVGKKKFLYDIWGDTVNTAARMETSAEPGRVNVSGTTYEFIKPYFECEYRGKIPVKNKGLIDMYYVNRIIPDLSEDETGTVANKKLFEVLNFDVYSELNYNKAKQYILNKLNDELPKDLYYHGVHHTKDVLEAAERIGKAEGVDNEHLMLIKLAALFHDSGFLTKYMDNEPVGADFAKELLPKYGFSNEQVNLVVGMILATKIPQEPKNHLEEIICDADLDYLGRSKDEFERISNSLKKEFLEHGVIQSEDQWDPIQVKFLSAHKYFTRTCRELREAEKLERLEEIKYRLAQQGN